MDPSGSIFFSNFCLKSLYHVFLLEQTWKVFWEKESFSESISGVFSLKGLQILSMFFFLLLRNIGAHVQNLISQINRLQWQRSGLGTRIWAFVCYSHNGWC